MKIVLNFLGNLLLFVIIRFFWIISILFAFYIKKKYNSNKISIERIGSIRIAGDMVQPVLSAINKIKTIDDNIYKSLIGGKTCKISVTGSIGQGASLYLIPRVFTLNIKILKLEDLLVSILIFWSFFKNNNSIQKWLSPSYFDHQKKEASKKTAEWLKNKDYSINLIQWIKDGGLEKDSILPNFDKP